MDGVRECRSWCVLEVYKQPEEGKSAGYPHQEELKRLKTKAWE